MSKVVSAFVLEVSHWLMLHGRVDQLKLIVVKLALIENNQCYTIQDIANILKISKSSDENCLHQLATLTALMFMFHISGKNTSGLYFCMHSSTEM